MMKADHKTEVAREIKTEMEQEIDKTQPCEPGRPVKEESSPTNKLILFSIQRPGGKTEDIQCDPNQAIFNAMTDHGVSCDKCIPKVVGEHKYVPNLGIPAKFVKGKTIFLALQKNQQGYSKERREYDNFPRESDHFFISFDEGYRQDRLLTYQPSSYYKNDKLRVDFLQGETFQDALSQDGRFKVENIDNCYLAKHTDTSNTVSLSYDADLYKGQIFYLNWKSKKTVKKSSKRPSLPEDTQNVSLSQEEKGKGEILSKDTTTSSGTASSSTLQITSKEADVVTDPNLIIRDMIEIISKHIGLDLNEMKDKRQDTQRRKKNDQLTMKLFSHSFKATPAWVLDRYIKSTGIISWRRSNGTCFRLGSRYVITNGHVFKLIQNAKCLLREVEIMFGFIEKESENVEMTKFSLKSLDVIFSDEKLDFAVLEIVPAMDSKIPPPLGQYISYFPQYGSPLYITGHPRGMPLQIDTHCIALHIKEMRHFPVRLTMSPNIREEPEKAVDVNRPIYDTCLVEGSSGSPVFTEDGHLVAMHARGFRWNTEHNIQNDIEQGISMLSICRHINKYATISEREIFEDLFPNWKDFDKVKDWE